MWGRGPNGRRAGEGRQVTTGIVFMWARELALIGGGVGLRTSRLL